MWDCRFVVEALRFRGVALRYGDAISSYNGKSNGKEDGQ